MPDDLKRVIPGNFERGIIRNVDLDIGQLPERLMANELLECRVHGTASQNYGQLGPNLISCEVYDAFFPSGVSHFDAKDSTFSDVRIYGDFTRIMVTRCIFRRVTFTRATVRDTVFLDSHFEDVVFEDCDLSVAVFKSNLFVRCRFEHCTTDNKLFEHCVFDATQLANIRLQHITILQNFGIRRRDTQDLVLYAPERDGSAIDDCDIVPANALEQACLEYFLNEPLDQSQALWDVVNLQLGYGSANSALHILTAIEQLSRFLIVLFNKGELRALFIVQLFWSLNRLSETAARHEASDAYIERMQTALVRLRPIYEEIAALVPPDRSYSVLVAEGFTRATVEAALSDVTTGASVISFEVYNSPSVAQLLFDMPAEAALVAVLIYAVRFKLEVESYHPSQRLLTVQAGLIQGAGEPGEYAALLAMNLPGLLFARLKVGIALSTLDRLRAVLLTIITKAQPPLHPERTDNLKDN